MLKRRTINWEAAKKFMLARFNKVDKDQDGHYPFKVEFKDYPPRITIEIFITSEDERRLEDWTLDSDHPTRVLNPTDEELGIAASQAVAMIRKISGVSIKRAKLPGVVYVVKPKLGYEQFENLSF